MSNKYVMIVNHTPLKRCWVKTLTLIAALSVAMLALPQESGCEEARVILRTGEIINIVGEVDIKRAGENFWMKASPGFLLSQYDMIRTHQGGRVDIEFNKIDGKYFKIRLRDESRLSLTRLEFDSKTTLEDILLDLAVGDILIKTDKLPRKSKFRVRTPTSMIGVRGTCFEVIYNNFSNQVRDKTVE